MNKLLHSRSHQTTIGTPLLLNLLILLDIVTELVHLALLVLGLLLALLIVLLALLLTGLVLVVLLPVVMVMVEDALHKVLVVRLVGSCLIVMKRVRNAGGGVMNRLGITDLRTY